MRNQLVAITFLLSFIISPSSLAVSALGYNELKIGFDGPVVEKPSLDSIDTKDALLNHWISEKLGEDVTNALLENIDFDSQFIAVVQVGVRNTATGILNIAEIEYNEEKTNVVVYVRVGVNDRGCNLPKHQSLPYAIGIIDKPIVWPTKVNYYIGNFPNGCKVPVGVRLNEI